MSIIEILDSEGIDSISIEIWINECQSFKQWRVKQGADVSDEVELNKAYLRIEPIIFKRNAKRI